MATREHLIDRWKKTLHTVFLLLLLLLPYAYAFGCQEAKKKTNYADYKQRERAARVGDLPYLITNARLLSIPRIPHDPPAPPFLTLSIPA
jgi:hypothetical protein